MWVGVEAGDGEEFVVVGEVAVPIGAGSANSLALISPAAIGSLDSADSVECRRILGV